MFQRGAQLPAPGEASTDSAAGGQDQSQGGLQFAECLADRMPVQQPRPGTTLLQGPTVAAFQAASCPVGSWVVAAAASRCMVSRHSSQSSRSSAALPALLTRREGPDHSALAGVGIRHHVCCAVGRSVQSMAGAAPDLPGAGAGVPLHALPILDRAITGRGGAGRGAAPERPAVGQRHRLGSRGGRQLRPACV